MQAWSCAKNHQGKVKLLFRNATVRACELQHRKYCISWMRKFISRLHFCKPYFYIMFIWLMKSLPWLIIIVPKSSSSSPEPRAWRSGSGYSSEIIPCLFSLPNICETKQHLNALQESTSLSPVTEAQFQLKKHYGYPWLLPIAAVPFQVNLNSTAEIKK